MVPVHLLMKNHRIRKGENMEFTFSDDEFERRLEQQTLIGQNFVDAVFQYWLEDNGDYRVPFPQYMLDELRECTLRLFLEWTFQIEDRDSITAELLSDKFEEIIQMVGLFLARTDEDRLTIQYPSLPRLGDAVHIHLPESETRIGNVIQRDLIEDEGKMRMRVRIRFLDTGEEWETGFDITD